MFARPLLLLATLASTLVLAACGGSSSTSSASGSGSTSASGSGTATQSASTTASATSGQLSYEGIPLEIGPPLGPAVTPQTGRVDGITCGPTEQLVYHIHIHLAVFSDGRLYSLPGGIGIPGSTVKETTAGPVAEGGQCIYWLHTHSSDGVIHVESPTYRLYTLGNFFDEWGQPLSANRVADVRGPVTAFVNGKLWKRSLRDIPLLPHELVQLETGQPAPPLMSISWRHTGL